MRKSTRIIGMSAAAAAGAVGTYLALKPKLRRELRKSHSANEAMTLIGHEIEHDALAVAGKAMDIGSEGLNRISRSLSPRPVATRSVTRRHAAKKAALTRKVKAATATHSSSK